MPADSGRCDECRTFATGAVKRTMKEFGKLDILVNNAAFQQHEHNIEDLSDAHFDLTIKTNLYGYFYMARAAVPHLKEGSSIVMNGSVTGIRGSGGLLDYSMTKGGIHAFAQVACRASDRPRHQGECRGAGPGVDAAQSVRQAGQKR